ncbi:MAG TPA: MBL fold metallo-hydrolase [Terriglobia bacterium]|nr:MBL fold metallo-hydrolase [Terriglobia bacterium]
MRKCVLAVVLLFTTTAFAQDARTVIDNASKAMGPLKTVEYSGSGFDFAVGQNANPNLPWPKFIDKTYKRLINFETPAFRMDRVRAQGENPPHGGGQQPVYGDQTQNQTVVVNANTPWVQQLEIWMMPHGFLQAAAKNNATVSSKTVGGKKYQVLTFTGQNKAKVNGYINDQNYVERVETWIDNPVLGDMLFDSAYSNYKDFGGVKFPTRIVQKQGDYPILDLTVTDVKANVAANIQAPNAPAAQAAQPTSEKLGDGVYLILGGYAALAVDFKDYIVVIEGPQSEERSNAIIAEAKKLIPNKPIRYVVNTHAHYDHSSGVRTFMAEGATIVTHQVNKPFLEKIAALPHTLNPDRQEQAKKKPAFETMTEKKVMTDGNHVIELYHMTNIGHHDGLIMAYLPKEKVLVEADAYNPAATPNATPPSPPSPYTLSLVSNIERLKLDVNRIIPIHYPADNRVVTRTELMRWLGKASSN